MYFVRGNHDRKSYAQCYILILHPFLQKDKELHECCLLSYIEIFYTGSESKKLNWSYICMQSFDPKLRKQLRVLVFQFQRQWLNPSLCNITNQIPCYNDEISGYLIFSYNKEITILGEMKVFFNLYSITSHFISEKMNFSTTIALFSFTSIFFCFVYIKKRN